MAETIVRQTIHPISVLLVLPDGDRWDAEPLRSELAAAGLRLIVEGKSHGGETGQQREPAAILVFLSGQPERDAAACRKWVGRRLQPALVKSGPQGSAFAAPSGAVRLQETGLSRFQERFSRLRRCFSRKGKSN